MDSSLYKIHTVPRGLNYHYYFSPPQANKSTLLFLHGFPASSFDWRKQVPVFQSKGYGIIAPDLLGAGKTSHPQDIAAFKMKDMSADVISILDAEGVDKVIGIGHDWGCGLLSSLVLFHRDRFQGTTWLCVPFMPPEPFDLATVNNFFKDTLGYELYAYWEYLIKESTPENLCKNVESLMQLGYPKDPKFWLTHMVVPGKTEEWVMNDTRPGRPSYLTDEEFERICADFVATGASALCWYKCYVSGINAKDHLSIPREDWVLKHPTLFMGASKDFVCTHAVGNMTMKRYGTDVTYDELPTGHWIHIERPQEVNDAITSWLEAHTL